ncbi:hypothetical protein K456DRAFT_1721829 [Colletotrichum gloeosporioides 23]|nr:hypothetical protein K456DRAFT_1721829 [Colletotrichum gloeosporioides 23]
MHSEWAIIASGPLPNTLRPFILFFRGLPNYLTYSYVMSSLSAVTTSPPARFTSLRTSTLLTHVFASSINNPLLYL